MQKRSQLTALLLASLLLCSSCSLLPRSQPPQNDDPILTAEANGTTADPYIAPARPNAAISANQALAALPSMDFGGASLLIAAATDATGNPLFPATDSLGEDIAKSNRNMLVSSYYKVSLVPSSASSGDIYNEVRKAQDSGLYYADVLLLPAYQVGRFAASGLLRNLRNLPYWSGSGAAYGEDANQGGAGTTVYADIGAAVLDHNSLPAVFFNRAMAESMGQDLYAAVDRGEWTWELYLQMAANAASLDGVAGHALVPPDKTTYIDLISASSGIDLLTFTEDRIPAVTVSESIGALDAILRSPLFAAAEFPTNAENKIAALQSFTVNGLLFCTANLSYMDWIYDADTAWGILPLPSMDGGIHAPTGACAPVLCVTADNAKFEMTGILLTALNTASTDVITEAYIEERLQNRLRDWQSAAMISRIAKNASYDFVTLFSSGIGGLAPATADAVREAAAGGKPLSELVSARAGTANGNIRRFFGIN